MNKSSMKYSLQYNNLDREGIYAGYPKDRQKLNSYERPTTDETLPYRL